jgi:predicted dehydrogenase
MTGAVGVALVGAGYWGSRLARNLAASPALDLVHVCDIDQSRAQALAHPPRVRATGLLAEVLADPGVSAIAVATPASTHGEIVAAALDAGRHVLVEKPLAMTTREARLLATRAARDELVVMCDQTYRFAPVVDVLEAQLGRATSASPWVAVESVRTNRHHGQPDVDVFWDLAYHDVAILAAVLPGGLRPLEVKATSSDVLGIGRAHRGDLWLELEEGPSVHVRVDWCAPEKVRTMTFASGAGEIRWDDLDPDGPLRVAGRRMAVLDDREPLARAVAEFAAAVRERRRASCGPAEELAVLTVLEAATCSAAQDGAPVPVGPMPLDALPMLP